MQPFAGMTAVGQCAFDCITAVGLIIQPVLVEPFHTARDGPIDSPDLRHMYFDRLSIPMAKLCSQAKSDSTLAIALRSSVVFDRWWLPAC